SRPAVGTPQGRGPLVESPRPTLPGARSSSPPNAPRVSGPTFSNAPRAPGPTMTGAPRIAPNPAAPNVGRVQATPAPAPHSTAAATDITADVGERESRSFATQ